MRHTNRLFAVVLFAAACRDSGGSTSKPDGNVPTGPVTIFDIQTPGELPTGTVVDLEGVVVTAIDTYGARTGNIWVQEPDGGAYSGVLIFGVSLDQVTQLTVGDIVNVSGAEVTEFALMEDMSGRKTTELVPPQGGVITVTKVSSGTALAPASVDALAIAALPQAERDAEWEKWEGVLIRLSGVTQTSPVSPISGDDMFREFRVNGGLRVDESLAMFPEGLTSDTCLASVTGIGDYFFNYKVLPRSTSELEVGGACPLENSAVLCGDDLDNDLDGFMDCEDVGCQLDPANGCQTATTIAQIQSGAVTGPVSVNNVVVTALSFDKKHLWIADAATSALGQGVYVFRGAAATALPAEFVPGAVVNVSGTVAERNNDAIGDTVTQLAGASVSVTYVGPGPVPTPLASNSALSTMVDPVAGEPYEGVLVSLQNVTIDTAADPNAFYVGRMSANGVTFLFDDDILRVTDAAATCFASVVGIWTYQVFDNEFGLLPLEVTPGCNTVAP